MTFYLPLQNVFEPCTRIYIRNISETRMGPPSRNQPCGNLRSDLFMMALQMDVLLPLLHSFALHLEGAQILVTCSAGVS